MTACCCSNISRMTACSAPGPGPISASRFGGCTLARGETYGWPVDYALGTVALDNRESRDWPRFLGRAEAGRDRRPARPALARAGRAAGGAARRPPSRRSARRLAPRRSVDRQHPRSGRPARRPGRSRLLLRPCRGRPGDARPVRARRPSVLARLMARSTRAGEERRPIYQLFPGSGPRAALGLGLLSR